MSFSCTLHPVDLRLVQLFVTHVQHGQANWKDVLRLWHKKRMIQQVNQSLKDGLFELIPVGPTFVPEIHLWGRPFFIASMDPEEVTRKIETLYSAKNLTEIEMVLLSELRLISEEAYWKRLGQEYPRHKEPKLGLNEVAQELHGYWKNKKYEELAEEMGFVLAQILALTYPFWETDRMGLSLLRDLEVAGWEEEPSGLAYLFYKLPEIRPYFPKRLAKSLSAGIYLSPVEVKALLSILRSNGEKWAWQIEQKQFKSTATKIFMQLLLEALTYAERHGFGLLEATDVFEDTTRIYP